MNTVGSLYQEGERVTVYPFYNVDMGHGHFRSAQSDVPYAGTVIGQYLTGGIGRSYIIRLDTPVPVVNSAMETLEPRTDHMFFSSEIH